MCRKNQQVQILNMKENGCPRLANSVLTLRDAVLAYYSCNLVWVSKGGFLLLKSQARDCGYLEIC